MNLRQAVQANLSLNAASQQEEGLISILHEYFMKSNYNETLEAFQRDCCRQTKAKPPSQEDLKKELLAVYLSLCSTSTRDNVSPSLPSSHSLCPSPCDQETHRPCASSSTSNFTSSSSHCIPSSARRRALTRRPNRPSSRTYKAEEPPYRNHLNFCNITH